MERNKIPARGHVLVWPSWRNLPSSISRHKEKPGPIPSQVLDHIQDISLATRNYVYEWDVLNAPYSNHDLMDIFGRKIMVDWLKAAREKNNSSARLYLNDYGILSEGGLNATHQDDYEETARYLLGNKAPLGGLGFQGHFGSTLTPPSKVLSLLDRYAKLKLPIKITEFDIDIQDETLQADYTRDFLYAAFSHPAVTGVQFWGFWEKQHWRPNAALYRANWDEKPNGRVFRELTRSKWWTMEKGNSDHTGSFSSRGFYGDYNVLVSNGDHIFRTTFNFLEDDQTIEARLDNLNLSPKLMVKVTKKNRLLLGWKNMTALKFRLQQSNDLIKWSDVDKQLHFNQSRPIFESTPEKTRLFFRLIAPSP